MRFVIERGKSSDSKYSKVIENEGNLNIEQINEIIWLRQDGNSHIKLTIISHPTNDLLALSVFTFPEEIVDSLQVQSKTQY
jgi:hypothetical protein